MSQVERILHYFRLISPRYVDYIIEYTLEDTGYVNLYSNVTSLIQVFVKNYPEHFVRNIETVQANIVESGLDEQLYYMLNDRERNLNIIHLTCIIMEIKYV